MGRTLHFLLILLIFVTGCAENRIELRDTDFLGSDFSKQKVGLVNFFSVHKLFGMSKGVFSKKGEIVGSVGSPEQIYSNKERIGDLDRAVLLKVEELLQGKVQLQRSWEKGKYYTKQSEIVTLLEESSLDAAMKLYVRYEAFDEKLRMKITWKMYGKSGSLKVHIKTSASYQKKQPGPSTSTFHPQYKEIFLNLARKNSENFLELLKGNRRAGEE